MSFQTLTISDRKRAGVVPYVPKILLPSYAFIKVTEDKLVKASLCDRDAKLTIGKRYQIFDTTYSGQFIFCYLHALLGDYAYWRFR